MNNHRKKSKKFIFIHFLYFFYIIFLITLHDFSTLTLTCSLIKTKFISFNYKSDCLIINNIFLFNKILKVMNVFSIIIISFETNIIK